MSIFESYSNRRGKRSISHNPDGGEERAHVRRKRYLLADQNARQEIIIFEADLSQRSFRPQLRKPIVGQTEERCTVATPTDVQNRIRAQMETAAVVLYTAGSLSRMPYAWSRHVLSHRQMFEEVVGMNIQQLTSSAEASLSS